MTDGSADSYLASHPVFKDVPPQQLALIASFATAQQVAAQRKIFEHDKRASHFYIVKSGKVTIEVPSLTGEPLTIQTLGPGAVLGWSWLLPPYRWLFDARATVPTEVVAVDGERLRAACEQDPALGYQVLKRFAALMADRLNAARLTAMRHYSGS
jgi:CRP/FNR family transcriptional regulator, cyclic AMP receptor protein